MTDFKSKAEDEFSFYLNDLLFKRMNGGWYYDTYASYGFAAHNLKKMNDEIKEGKILRIESEMESLVIESTDEFRNWVMKEFNHFNNGGFQKFLEKPFK